MIDPINVNFGNLTYTVTPNPPTGTSRSIPSSPYTDYIPEPIDHHIRNATPDMIRIQSFYGHLSPMSEDKPYKV